MVSTGGFHRRHSSGLIDELELTKFIVSIGVNDVYQEDVKVAASTVIKLQSYAILRTGGTPLQRIRIKIH